MIRYVYKLPEELNTHLLDRVVQNDLNSYENFTGKPYFKNRNDTIEIINVLNSIPKFKKEYDPYAAEVAIHELVTICINIYKSNLTMIILILVYIWVSF